MHQQLWGYKVEEKLYVGVREQKRLNTAVLDNGNAPQNHSTTTANKSVQGVEQFRYLDRALTNQTKLHT
jgi:hypothetical protein